MKIRGVLLDIDGTLLDSNDAHALAWVESLEETRRIRISEDYVRGLIGMGGDKMMQILVGVPEDSRVGKEITTRCKSIFMHKYLKTLLPFEGTRELLLRFRERGLSLTVATSASGTELGGLLKQTGIDDLIGASATKSDVQRSKPDPDIIAHAAKKSGFRPRELVMIGDTPYDVEAARKAGVASIAFRCGGHLDEELVGATEIYDGPRDLLNHYEESILNRADGNLREAKIARRAL